MHFMFLAPFTSSATGLNLAIEIYNYVHLELFFSILSVISVTLFSQALVTDLCF